MNRDYLGNLLGLSDLSNMSTFQAVERALHKLENTLIRRNKRTGKPTIIVMNNCQLLPRDENGTSLLRLFQQRAERELLAYAPARSPRTCLTNFNPISGWASTGACTFVFVSNDYFVYDVLRKSSVRMDTLTFKDLTRKQSVDALRKLREYYWGDSKKISSRTLNAVYDVVGGRVALLNRIAHRRDMLKAANQLVEDEMHWLLSKTGIIVDHDDDVSRTSVAEAVGHPADRLQFRR